MKETVQNRIDRETLTREASLCIVTKTPFFRIGSLFDIGFRWRLKSETHLMSKGARWGIWIIWHNRDQTMCRGFLLAIYEGVLLLTKLLPRKS